MEPGEKANPVDVETRLGRQLLAYRNDYEDVEFLLSVDPDRYSVEDQDNMAKFIMRAIVAYQGFIRNEQKIGEICGLVAFGIPNKLTRFMKGIEQKVREAFAYSMALVLGYEEYHKGLDMGPPDVDELPPDLPRGFYIPFNKGRDT